MQSTVNVEIINGIYEEEIRWYKTEWKQKKKKKTLNSYNII